MKPWLEDLSDLGGTERPVACALVPGPRAVARKRTYRLTQKVSQELSHSDGMISRAVGIRERRKNPHGRQREK